jgi:hypothetical protein
METHIGEGSSATVRAGERNAGAEWGFGEESCQRSLKQTDAAAYDRETWERRGKVSDRTSQHAPSTEKSTDEQSTESNECEQSFDLCCKE